MEDTKLAKITTIAEDVLRLSRNTLLVHLRFLDRALHQLTVRPCEQSTLMTDGEHLLFNAVHVLKNFRYQQTIPVRDYLHVVMHGVFRHMFIDATLNRPLWDLACDIAVEAVINELGLQATEAPRQAKQQETLEKLKEDCTLLTAEKLYHHFVNAQLDPAESAMLRAQFYADDHRIWYMTDQEKEQEFGTQPSSADTQNAARSRSFQAKKLAEEWKAIAEQLQVDLETFGKKQGDKSGVLTQNLREVNRERYDYTAFLKKFAVPCETMKINDEEFDYVFYNYGMQLYGNMPLVEPLEYKDTLQIREFVIAIDTSASVSGEQVQRFVQKTYNILKSTESFHSKINLHILQCDAAVQEHVKITSQEEFDNYLKTMTIKGLGGTDFRPVFQAVDDLLAKHEFSNLKGLLYFTDGHGIYPQRKPDYQTAFLFVEDPYNQYQVPPWAIRLILPKDSYEKETRL